VRPSLSAIAGIAFASLAPGVAAQLYKCEGDAGIPVYQDAPCNGRELRNFAADPAPVSVLPMPPPKGATTRLTAPAPAPKPAILPSGVICTSECTKARCSPAPGRLT
jgi:hypothetical protein